MTIKPFEMTIGDGVRINYDQGCLDLSPQQPTQPGISLNVPPSDPCLEIRLAYSADSRHLIFFCGLITVATVSIQCTAEEATMLSHAMGLVLEDAEV